jgi:hypothetical protein
MVLAEKGGVCIMTGVSCCTYIPNNTAPDGTITKALQGLTTPSDQLAENGKMVWEMEGLDALNLNLFGHSG